MQPYVICYRGIAHPWLCDRLGHLNTRHYFAALDDAMNHFFSFLGFEQTDDAGWADVSHSITYKTEIRAGKLFHVESALVELRSKAITYKQLILLTDTREVAAECISTTVLFDIINRKAMSVPDIIKENSLPYLLPSGVD